MMELKVVITGALGKMGRELVRYAVDNEGWELCGVTEHHNHPDIGKDIGRLLIGAPLGICLEKDLEKTMVGPNVIIDFTSPDATLFHLRVASENQMPIVIGTTGFDNAQLEKLEQLAQKTKVIFSPNMSIGVNLLWKLASQAAKILRDEFDAEIVEVHHRNKTDSPSGTAIELARSVADALGKKADDIMDHGRQGQVGVRDFGRIGMHSIRGGDIVGDHKLSFFGPGEEFFIGHRATDRINFVKGAYKAAMFCQSAKKGLYSMADVLKL